jgi:hypothetical protein
MSAIDRFGKGGAAALGLARDAVDTASPKLKQWLKTGAALGVARTGARVASGVVRRNPGLALAAAAVGAGYLAYTAYRKHASAAAANVERTKENPANTTPIDSTATVVETRKRRQGGSAGAQRKSASPAASANEDVVKPAAKTTAKRARKRSATP